MSIARVSFSAVLAVAVAMVVAAPAHAGWTRVVSVGDSVLLACKTPEESGYGPVWKITLVLANSHRDVVGGARVNVRRNGTRVTRTTLRTWAPGQWDVDTTYASRLFRDRLQGTAGFGDGQGHGAGESFKLRMSRIRRC